MMEWFDDTQREMNDADAIGLNPDHIQDQLTKHKVGVFSFLRNYIEIRDLSSSNLSNLTSFHVALRLVLI